MIFLEVYIDNDVLFDELIECPIIIDSLFDHAVVFNQKGHPNQGILRNQSHNKSYLL